jgi:hypothetical protein
MKNKLIESAAIIVLVIVLSINAFMLVRIWLIIRADTVLRENKVSYILPEGFTPAKTKNLWDKSLYEPSGWVVRYADKDCVYCVLDFEWERLLSRLERLNYRTIVLLPREAGQFADASAIPENVQQMAFVKMDWVKQFRFTNTPTTIIFNNNGHVLWQHVGMLTTADYNSAQKTLE